ncbi:MAG: hypothetical protein ACRED0_08235 [Gammaproteobacteria bacterium]
MSESHRSCVDAHPERSHNVTAFSGKPLISGWLKLEIKIEQTAQVID